MEAPALVPTGTCPALTGRVFNITDAEFASGERRIEVSRPTAFLTTGGVRLPAVEAAMNRQLQKRPISRGKVHQVGPLSWDGAELVFDVPGREFELGPSGEANFTARAGSLGVEELFRAVMQ